MVSEKKKSMRANGPRGIANLDPKDMIGRIYVGYHLTLLHMLHTKYTGFRPSGCREKEEIFFILFIL